MCIVKIPSARVHRYGAGFGLRLFRFGERNMIAHYVQPKQIVIDDSLSLVKYYPNYKKTFPWYQDLDVCKQVDNRDSVYDLKLLSQMYRYLSKAGECFYIKFRENGRSYLVGDITLYNGEIAVVICKEYQNRHIGRKAVAALLKRAKDVGWTKVEAEIYAFNEQSKKMFLSLGFRQISEERYCYEL